MTVSRGDAVALTAALVRVDSRNPSLDAEGPGEGACARVLADVLTAWGFAVDVRDAAPGRPNVVARLAPPAGSATGRSLMLNGHLDVVGVDGMTHAPFEPVVRDGLLYGRGSADMKAGIAAMCAAAVRAYDRGTLRGEVIVTAVADEEFSSLGTRAVVDAGIRADGAIITEPTSLRVMPAHRGFAWLTVTATGRAAHGSRYDIGVDAIRHAGHFLAALDAFEEETLVRRPPHPLLGRPSIHASLIDGGSGISTYPERCVLRLERRTLPGETDAQVHDEIRTVIDTVRATRPALDLAVTLDFAQPASDVAPDAAIVRALVDALGTAREAPTPLAGMSAWTDAALLNAAGIPTICFGPGDIGVAHAATEYVPLDEIARAAAVLEHLVAGWCG